MLVEFGSLELHLRVIATDFIEPINPYVEINFDPFISLPSGGGDNDQGWSEPDDSFPEDFDDAPELDNIEYSDADNNGDAKSSGENPMSKTEKDLGDQTFLLAYAASFTALCAEDAPPIKLGATRIGRAGGLVNLYSTYRSVTADGHLSWGDKAKLGVGAFTYVGSNWTPPEIAVPFIVGAFADYGGKFNNWYKLWDIAEVTWNSSGFAFLPIGTPNPILISKH